MFERFAKMLNIENNETNYLDILQAMYDYATSDDIVYMPTGEYYHKDSSIEDRDEILDFWEDKVLAFSKTVLFSSPQKSPCNNTPIIGNHIYWITLTPPLHLKESLLRDYIKYLVPKVPNIFGAFEVGESNNFHCHFIVQLDKKIDISKAPFIKYQKDCQGKILTNKNMFLCKNYEYVLHKLRYICQDIKDNKGYFGNYEFFNNVIKTKLDVIIKKDFKINI